MTIEEKQPPLVALAPMFRVFEIIRFIVLRSNQISDNLLTNNITFFIIFPDETIIVGQF